MSKQMSRQQSRQTQRRERKEEERRRELARQAAARRRNIIIASIIACAVIVAGVIVATNLLRNNSASGSNTNTNPQSDNPLYPVVNNVSCDQNEHSDTHFHTRLTIYMNNQQVPLPQNIGIASDQSCLYWLHTHDSTGIIHIEAPSTGKYTLGTFLRVWRERFPSLQYVDQLSATDGWKAYVNGKEYTGDFDNIELKSHDLITLMYNSPDKKPDTQFSWPSDLPE